MTVKDINTKIIPVLESQGILKSVLFGSVVRGERRKDNERRLLDLVGLKLKLEDTLSF